MYPSRPSSSDPNAPYRNAIAAFADHRIDGVEGQPDDEPQNVSAQNQPNVITDLNPRRTTNRDILNTIARNIGPNIVIGTSSASNVTITTIRDYLREKGELRNELMDYTIINRFDSTNISANTFFTSIKIAYSADHPLLTTLRVNSNERSQLIHRLVGIFTRAQSFKPWIRKAMQDSNNDPEQLIANILQSMRISNS